MTEDYGHWINEQGEPGESTFGFLYTITHKESGRMYIGKKQLTRQIKHKPLKGKKKRRIEHKESDWKTYCSSSKNLQTDIDAYGIDQFVFRIIRWCDSKWELAYFEAKMQFDNNVMVFPERFYNGIVNLRVNKPPKKFLKDLVSGVKKL